MIRIHYNDENNPAFTFIQRRISYPGTTFCASEDHQEIKELSAESIAALERLGAVLDRIYRKTSHDIMDSTKRSVDDYENFSNR